MTVLVAKAVDFIFNARAVARAFSLDTAGKHRAVLKSGAQNVVSLEIRAGDPAAVAVVDRPRGAVAHRPWIFIARLHLQNVEVNRRRVKTARRTGL